IQKLIALFVLDYEPCHKAHLHVVPPSPPMGARERALLSTCSTALLLATVWRHAAICEPYRDESSPMLVALRFHRRGSAARSGVAAVGSRCALLSRSASRACPDFCKERVSERAGRRPRHYRVGRHGGAHADDAVTPAW